MASKGLAALIFISMFSWPATAAGLEPDGSGPPAHVTIASFRLTDDSDHDGIADPRETVSLYLTLRNGTGSDLTGVVIEISSNDAHVGCMPTPVASFGSLLAGEVKEAPVPVIFQLADVNRADVTDELSATLNVTITGDGFQAAPQSVTLDLDLDRSGGFLPSTFTEGFEVGTLGTFTVMSLEPVNSSSNSDSDGLRCQYNDPDFVNSNAYGNQQCFLRNTGYDWHLHGLGSPDGGRAYLGNNSLHWGMHPSPGSPAEDTTRVGQLEAIRLSSTVNLGWNGVTSELSFKHQIGIVNCDYTYPVNCPDDTTVDRAIVQVQPAAANGLGVGRWIKIRPYQNDYDLPAQDYYTNCTFDPTDDGNDEDDYFDPTDPARRLGPSSTCAPEFAFSRQGAILFSAAFDPADIHRASDGPGLQGSLGPGTWVETKFNLARWGGRRVRFRFVVSTIEVPDYTSMQDFFFWNPTDADDGWYIDDVKVTNTLQVPATLTVDTLDRDTLPNSSWFLDSDQDGFGDPSNGLVACNGSPPEGYVADQTDCDDTNPAVHPGVADAICNGVDDNCSGIADEQYLAQTTACGTGVCARSGTTSCVGGVVHDSCTPGPATAPDDATCDAVDQDCSGAADEDYQSVPDRWVPMTLAGTPPSARSHHTAVAVGPGQFIVWGGVGPGGVTFQNGALYDAQSNAWFPTSMATGVPSPRQDHRAVWTAGWGMVVFGGNLGTTYLNTGSRWDAGGWTALSTFQAPSERALHVQVAAGADVIVWGGRNAFTQTNTGARWSNGSWLPMSTINAPSARFNATGVWTGSVMIVWGGEALGSPLNTVFNTGAIFNPISNTWTPIPTAGAPSARTRHTAVWTGSRMIVWGGFNGNATYLGDGAAYDLQTNTWSALPSAGAPAARADHQAIWNNDKMLVWGGWNGGPLATGGRYDPATNTWTPLVASSSVGHPGTRHGSAVWTNWPFGSNLVMAVWGGETGPSQYTGVGAFYQPDSSCGQGPCLRQGGTVCAGGTEVYLCIPGQQQPETCNSVDDNCDGIVDNQVGGNPGMPCLKASKDPGFLVTSSLSWVALPGATSYDVVRGILPTLRSSGGDYTASVDACLANNTAALTVSEPNDPLVGGGFWHLLRANLSGGPGTYDEGSPRQVGLRDAEIAAAAGACP